MRKGRQIIMWIACGLFFLLLVLLPWHATVLTYLLDGLGLRSNSFVTMMLPAYKEVLLLILVFICGAIWLIDKGWREQKWPWFILLYGIVMMLVTSPDVIVGDISLVQVMFGARTEFGFFAALFAGGILVPYFNERQIKLLLGGLITTFIVSLIWAFGLQILGHEKLISIGFSDSFSTFAEGQAPAYCQKEGGTDFCRMQGPFAGPNRWAAYLLTVLPLVWFRLKKLWLRILLVVIVLLAIGLTLSSGAYLALGLVGGLILAWRYSPSIFKEFWFYVLGVAGMFIAYLLAEHYLLGSSLHVQKLVAGVIEFLKMPFGQGIGFAGPAALKVGIESVPESWYVQVLINGGIFGFFAFGLSLLAIMQPHVRKLYMGTWKCLENYSAVFLIITMLLLGHNLFLHTLEVAGAYLVWGFVFGLAEKSR